MKPKGGVRLDQLAADFGNHASRAQWLAALEQIKTGKMPPEPKPRLAEKDARTITDWIKAGVKTADAERGTEGRVVLRLNRNDYENTILDLLGIEVRLKATGGAPASGDQAEIEAIVAKSRDKNYGFRSLVHQVVQSQTFRRKRPGRRPSNKCRAQALKLHRIGSHFRQPSSHSQLNCSLKAARIYFRPLFEAQFIGVSS